MDQSIQKIVNIVLRTEALTLAMFLKQYFMPLHDALIGRD